MTILQIEYMKRPKKFDKSDIFFHIKIGYYCITGQFSSYRFSKCEKNFVLSSPKLLFDSWYKYLQINIF